MKHTIFIFMALAIVAASCGSNEKSDSFAVISGKWERLPAGKSRQLNQLNQINLYRLENGRLVQLASSVVGEEDSTICFACKPSAQGDFYYVGLHGTAGNDRYAFFLRGGERLDFCVNDTSYTLQGSNTPENRELAQWHNFVQPLEWKSFYFRRNKSTYVDFFPLLEEKLTALKDYPQSGSGNKDFDRRFEEFKKCNFLDIALYFLHTPRTTHPEGEDYPDFYRNLNIQDFTRSVISNYPHSLELIERMVYVKSRLDNKSITSPTLELLQNMDAYVSNDTIKGEVALRYAGGQRTPDKLAAYEQTYGKYLLTDRQKAKFAQVKAEMDSVKVAADFSFPDKSGKMVALSDFKGKLVYIDVWATWCGPCRRELPFLRKLEAEYHSNKDIVFLGVATDDAQYKAKWEKFLSDGKMQGVQLFAGDRKSDILTPYGIAGIPRYMLVGADGNLILANAPRPSSPEIRATLNKYLKK
jgi:thiol-disulfide isomerase/thioredoxin